MQITDFVAEAHSRHIQLGKRWHRNLRGKQPHFLWHDMAKWGHLQGIVGGHRVTGGQGAIVDVKPCNVILNDTWLTLEDYPLSGKLCFDTNVFSFC